MQKILARILKVQAKALLKNSSYKMVVVSGSVGKTSTTQAVASVLSEKFNVISTLKNYNTDIGVPCSIFGYYFPDNLKNPFAWVWLLFKNQIKVIAKKQIDVYVLEIGTDKPGDLAKFEWLNPDIAVVTAVAAEHMEFFKTLDAVAKEELSVGNFSEKTIINKRMIDHKYLKYARTEELYNYDRSDISYLDLTLSDLKVVGDHSIDAIAAAVAVGKSLGMNDAELKKAAINIIPQPGRMNILNGVSGSTLIDDTYNSSPEATIAALDYLYSINTNQRIALLGNMNELGNTSAKEHKKIGEYCDPKKLDLVVTLGEHANNYLATSAKKKGCRVVTCLNPFEAAKEILNVLRPDAAVLFKGSQNRVFAEEAVKIMLKNPEDESRLVRRGKFWDKKRKESFTNG